jgi:exo-1,4-beta-D-glucosaminidase
MDWAHKKDTVYTPQKEFGDLTGLNSLPQIKLEATVQGGHKPKEGIYRVIVKNPSSSIAFQIHARLINRKDNDDIVPIFWDDNYFSLLPGEEKAISATYSADNLDDDYLPDLEIDGFNIVNMKIEKPYIVFTNVK